VFVILQHNSHKKHVTRLHDTIRKQSDAISRQSQCFQDITSQHSKIQAQHVELASNQSKSPMHPEGIVTEAGRKAAV
jgi:hypothetical protein